MVTTYIALLRGINLAGRRKVAMPALREALAEAGFEDVATYIQSGNLVLDSGKSAAGLRTELEKLIEDRFGFAVPVIVRTRKQLDAVISANPFPEPADPRLLHVVFLEKAASAAAVKKLAASATRLRRGEGRREGALPQHPRRVREKPAGCRHGQGPCRGDGNRPQLADRPQTGRDGCWLSIKASRTRRPGSCSPR